MDTFLNKTIIFRQAKLVLLFLIPIINSCGQTDKNFDYGQLNGTIYENSYFGIQLKVPENWYFIDKDGRTEIAKENIDRFTKDNPEQNKLIQEAQDFTASIFTLFKHSPDTVIEVNPNITIVATKIKSYPKLKNIEYAIKLGQKGMKEANPAFIFDDKIFDKYFDKALFKGYNANITIDGKTAHYDLYLANFNEYNINLTISYGNEKQKAELYSVLENIKIQ